jgi:DNA-binding transcriptional ArsR family regulator
MYSRLCPLVTISAAAKRMGAPRDKRSTTLDLGMLHANARQAGEFLKSLSHEVRLLILCFLCNGEKSVGEIEHMLSLRQPAVSQQLARLRADGLVETRRNGKNIYYSLARSEVRDVIQVLHDVFCRARRPH